MAEYEGVLERGNFVDRKVRLVVLGVIQIIFGVICALMLPLMIFAMAAAIAAGDSMPEGTSAKSMMPAVLIYLAAAVWFISMGIGSIAARRWARALILVSSWLWLVCGTIGFVLILTFLPSMYDEMGKEGQMPQVAVAIMKSIMFVFLLLLYVVIPVIFVLCYSGKDVKATCECRDPEERWTDKCPLPVLAISMMSAVWVVSMFSVMVYEWTIPFFGIVLSGVAGAIVVLVSDAAMAYIAWGTYKLDMKAWWCAVVMYSGWFLSGVITFSTVSMDEFYKKMNFSGQQLEMMEKYNMLWRTRMSLFMVFWIVVFLAYLIYIRRYFVNALEEGNPLRVTDEAQVL